MSDEQHSSAIPSALVGGAVGTGAGLIVNKTAATQLEKINAVAEPGAWQKVVRSVAEHPNTAMAVGAGVGAFALVARHHHHAAAVTEKREIAQTAGPTP